MGRGDQISTAFIADIGLGSRVQKSQIQKGNNPRTEKEVIGYG